ncbi:MAG: hypothetical protein VX793_10130 [Pseudomonadota bacterium]|nr:hypothetical protein [Pseudomonadota bacterium]
MDEITKEKVFEYLSSWHDFDNMLVVEEDEAYKVTVVREGKEVVIITPYEVGEFFLDFSLDGKDYYSDWYEIMDDTLEEFMSYTKKVVERFLYNEVRVRKKGWWVFKTHSLEYLENSSWKNLFK